MLAADGLVLFLESIINSLAQSCQNQIAASSSVGTEIESGIAKCREFINTIELQRVSGLNFYFTDSIS